MGYLFYKGKLYADEVLIDELLDEESGNSIANKTVTNALADIEDDIDALDAAKQDTINDLVTIRSGATAGSTAVQPNQMSSAIANAVAANPTLQGGENPLTSIRIGNTIYYVDGVGSSVVANPAGEATATLSKLQVGQTIYTVQPASWIGQLTVRSMVGSTIIVNSQSYTLTGSEIEHTFTGLAYGQYTVTVTKQGYFPVSNVVSVAGNNAQIIIYPSVVPAQYTQLQYITSAGTAFMDSGIIINLDDEIETDFLIQQTTAGCLFGDGPVNTNNYVNHWWVGSSGASYWGTGTYTALISHIPSTTEMTNIKINKSGLWYNGTLRYSRTAATSLTTTRPTLKVFGAPSGSYQYCKGQMGHFSIVDYQGVYRLDWYPVIDNYSNAIGMFDRVSGRMTICPFSGFSAGPAVLPPVFDPIVDIEEEY